MGKRIGAVLLGLLTAPWPMAAFCAGSAPPQLLREAERLLDAGAAPVAVQRLETGLLEHAGDPHYDYLLGLALYRAGRHGEAVFALERVLMAVPSHSDARLLLAGIAAAAGEAARTRELLAQAEGYPLTPEQRREAASIRGLATEGAEPGSIAWQAYLLGGLGWDSNVTAGPDEGVLLLPGVDPLRPSPLGDATGEADALAQVDLGGNLRAELGERVWLLGGGNLHRDFYRDRSDMREGYLNLYLGLARQWRGEQVSLAALGQEYAVGGSDYRTMRAARFTWSHTVGPDSRIDAYYQHSDFRYPDLPGDDAIRRVGGIGHELTLGGGWRVDYGVHGGTEDTRRPETAFLGYRLWGAHVTARRPIGERLTLAGGLLYEAHDHGEPDPLYLEYRDDRVWSAGVSADYRVAARLRLIAQLAYIRNRSDLEIYDYTRAVSSLALRWDWGDESF